MRSSFVVGAGILAALCASCGFVVTGDDALADEFARFKAAGGNCAATSPDAPDARAKPPTRYAHPVLQALLSGLQQDLVAPSGRVRYGVLQEDERVQAGLDLAVAQLAAIDPAELATPADRLAFWINAYNTLVLASAAKAYAGDPAFRVDQDGFAFFDRREHDVGGALYSLNEIEHGVIRGARTHASTGSLPDAEWEALRAQHEAAFGGAPLDARVHFVLNCASTSCPPLAPFPYDGENLAAQMEAATAAFLADEEKGAGPNGVSELFAFYQEDFDAEGGVEAFIARYRPAGSFDAFRYLFYDWSLNVATD